MTSVETSAVDIECPGCKTPVGARCPGGLCQARINAAAKKTRDENRALREKTLT